jgi:hypothetical protein
MEAAQRRLQITARHLDAAAAAPMPAPESLTTQECGADSLDFCVKEMAKVLVGFFLLIIFLVFGW